MVMKTEKDVWKESTKPVRMLRKCVLAGKPRQMGEIVEVNQRDHFLVTTKGWAEEAKVVEKDLGEPKTKKRKTRKKASK